MKHVLLISLLIALPLTGLSGHPAASKSPIHTLGSVTSPDGLYVADAVLAEGEARHLQIRRGTTVVFEDPDTMGFAWAPGAPHSLIFGASGVYGTARLGLWKTGGMTSLVSSHHPTEEWFELVGLERSHYGVQIRFRHVLANGTRDVKNVHRKQVTAKSLE